MTISFSPHDRARLLQQELSAPRPVSPSRRDREAPAVRTQVVTAAQFKRVKDRANAALKTGQEHFTALTHARDNYRPDAYKTFASDARDRFVNWLKEENARVEADFQELIDAYPKPATPMPLTTSDSINLNTKMMMLSNASPRRILAEAHDAAQRNDAPLLAALRTLVDDAQDRPSWQTPDAMSVIFETKNALDAADWSPDAEAAAVAEEQIVAHRQGWQSLIVTMTEGDGTIPDTYQMIPGVYGPLLDAPKALGNAE